MFNQQNIRENNYKLLKIQNIKQNKKIQHYRRKLKLEQKARIFLINYNNKKLNCTKNNTIKKYISLFINSKLYVNSVNNKFSKKNSCIIIRIISKILFQNNNLIKKNLCLRERIIKKLAIKNFAKFRKIKEIKLGEIDISTPIKLNNIFNDIKNYNDKIKKEIINDICVLSDIEENKQYKLKYNKIKNELRKQNNKIKDMDRKTIILKKENVKLKQLVDNAYLVSSQKNSFDKLKSDTCSSSILSLYELFFNKNETIEKKHLNREIFNREIKVLILINYYREKILEKDQINKNLIKILNSTESIYTNWMIKNQGMLKKFVNLSKENTNLNSKILNLRIKNSNLEEEFLSIKNKVLGRDKKINKLEKERCQFTKKYREYALKYINIFNKEKIKQFELNKNKKNSLLNKNEEKFTNLKLEVSRLRKKVFCPICIIREKNVILLNCFHVFCKYCVSKMISSRSRKCPICKKSCGLENYKEIFFYYLFNNSVNKINMVIVYRFIF